MIQVFIVFASLVVFIYCKINTISILSMNPYSRTNSFNSMSSSMNTHNMNHMSNIFTLSVKLRIALARLLVTFVLSNLANILKVLMLTSLSRMVKLVTPIGPTNKGNAIQSFLSVSY